MNSGALHTENHSQNMLHLEERYSPLNLNENIFTNYRMLNPSDVVDNLLENGNYGGYNGSYQMEDGAAFNGTYHVVPNVPINLMPPLPHNINNGTHDGSNRRNNWRSRDELRSNSPHDSESDDSFTSRNSPSNSGGRRRARNHCSPFYGNSLLYNRYSSSSPSVFLYATPGQTSQHTQTCQKVRYYINSCNRQKREHRKRQPHDLHSRVHGLMERFTSRSRLLRINPNPSGLSPLDWLSQSIWDVFCAKAQKEETYLRKLELWKSLYLNMRKTLFRYSLFMVGSTMSGFGTEKSDIDICLLVRQHFDDMRYDALSYLQNIQFMLNESDLSKQTEVILAKVPILKFRDYRYGFEVDLNCNNTVGIRNTHLLHCYAHLDWRVRPLVIVVKLWAQANDINDAKRMTISSYSLTLMVVHYLQCGVTPPAIPCLHGLHPEKFSPDTEIHSIDIQEELKLSFSSDNKQSLGELFLGFLRYYSYFDYDRYAVSVREGSVLRKEECRFTKSEKNDVTQWKLLCIEEPFDLTNTARSVYDVETFEHIKNVFQCSYKTLSETKNLNSVLPNLKGPKMIAKTIS